VNANPVSHVTTALRGLMGGGATAGQVGLALLAPATITVLLAPVVLWLYRRR
jgi:ABC-2 type transport system permease protein